MRFQPKVVYGVRVWERDRGEREWGGGREREREIEEVTSPWPYEPLPLHAEFVPHTQHVY